MLRLLAAGAALMLCAPCADAGGRSTDVVIDSGDGALHGTLLLPGGDEPAPIALILPGSGPTDRDGNQPGVRHDAYRRLAEGLADAGIATLRIDKRGVGASAGAAGDEAGLSVDTYLSDALAWLDMLAEDDRFSRVHLIGHSEGALYAILAAEPFDAGSLVLISGIGSPAGDAIRWQLDQSGLTGDLRSQVDAILAELEAGRTVDDPPAELAALFRRSVQPYLISWFAIGPAARLARLDVATLVVHGTTDIQVPVEEARRLADARDGIDLVVIEGMNHILRVAPAERSANLATYDEPDRPLADGLVEAVAGFIHEHDG